MKRSSTILLKIAVIIVAIAVLALCIFLFPEGMKGDETNGLSPILFGMYITAIPFYIALYQTMKLLGYIDKNIPFSELSIKALKVIKYCALIIAACYAAGTPYMFHIAGDIDAPGIRGLGLIVVFASLVIAIASGVLQTLVQRAIDIKAENDLTV